MCFFPIFSSYSIVEEINKISNRRTSIISNKTNKQKYFLIQYSKLNQIEINEIRYYNSIRNNNHLINCKDIIYQTDDMTYNCITDYAENLSLHHYIIQSTTHIKEDMIWQTLIQMLYGILYLHNNNIVHRHIKLSHIYLQNDCKTVKVGGFKLCEILNEKNSLKRLPASLNYLYAAPEIINNEVYDMSSDIWSIGACIYEMCFISSQFKQPETYFNMLKGIIAPIPQGYSFELKKIIISMLSVKPLLRPTCVQLLGNPIVLRNVTNIQYHINCISQGNEKMNKIARLEDINKDNISNHILQKEHSLLLNVLDEDLNTTNTMPSRINIFSVTEQQKARNNSFKSAKSQYKKERKRLNTKDKTELNITANKIKKQTSKIHTSNRENKIKILFKKENKRILDNNLTKSTANTFYSSHRITSPKVNNTYCLSHVGNNYNNVNNRKIPRKSFIALFSS